ncbi:unnamed protein product [Miscanthus lutarioriparius]|uniref:Uncharacterized protein n=1 Tax=Miscanthus lutarioriparius TaxID=422564 RepID=A0A811RDV2_9POAL|nr:unnamed protein product [Miscanthus lutarioriparius]
METTAGSSSSQSSMERSGERSPYSSPITYRHPSYSYTSSINCYCSQKTPRWISWSNGNPGGGTIHATNIGFWVWLDPKPIDHQIEIFVDLRDAVKALHNKNKTLELEKNELSFLLDEAHVENAKLVKEKKEARALVKELEAKALAKELEAKLQLVALFSKGAKACCGSVILLAMFLALLVAMFSKGAKPLKLQLL